MSTINAFRHTADSTNANIENVLNESRDACDCMALEHSVGILVQLLHDIWRFDRQLMRDIYEGKQSVSMLDTDDCRILVNYIQKLIPRAIEACERFAGEGYDVPILAELQGFDIGDLGIIAIVQDADGGDSLPAKHIKDAITAITMLNE